MYFLNTHTIKSNHVCNNMIAKTSPARTRLLTLFVCLITLLPMIQSTAAQEISFWEEYALSTDRAQTLEKLVPGSEDYYYFHSLHLQNESQSDDAKLDEVDSLLKKWIKRNGRTGLVRQIQNRQALLRYSEDPAKTLKHLTDELNLRFNHQRKIPSAQRDLPTVLNPGRIDLKKQIKSALNRDNNSLSKFQDDGLIYLAESTLNTRQRRDLLKRITLPNFPNLVDLIAADLKAKDSKGFGKYAITRRLTREQMDQLADKVPTLRNNREFVNEYLLRLQPDEDSNWRVDRKARREYLDRLLEFTSTLSDERYFQSLEANVLFHLLELDLDEGKPNRKRFMQYLAMPRNAGYLNPDFLKAAKRKQTPFLLTDDFQSLIHTLPINNDQPLVQEYLQHFLAKAPNTKAFAPYLSEDYLKQQYATAKILSGADDREQWASLLTPSQYESLRQRIDIDFDRTNPEFFSPGDAVELKVHTKNVEKLIVKVFELNTENYYKRFGREIDTDINLDGLVANEEQALEFDDSPFLRNERSIKLDSIKKRGVYVVDFIGGGKSSRALVRIGRLQMVGRTILTGQRFNVINESGATVTDANIRVGGRQYFADKDSNIDIPFSTQPSRQAAVISQGNFSCLQMFDQVAENFTFKAAFHLDREALTRGNEASVIIRPSLKIADRHPVPVAMIDDARLVITSITLDGIETKKTISDLKLTEAGETVVDFNVPPRLRTIRLDLFGSVENSVHKKQQIAASNLFSINQIDGTERVQDVHLIPTSSGYFLEVLGKTGETRASQPVRVNLQMIGLKDKVDVDLQSDQSGLIELGNLSAVDSITATVAGGSQRSWNLHTAGIHLDRNYHLLSGETVKIPMPADLKELSPLDVSLYEIRSDRITRDCYDKLSLAQGAIKASKLEPGDYELRFRSRLLSNSNAPIKIRVIAGQQASNVLVGKKRFAEDHSHVRPYIFKATSKDDSVTFQVKNVTKSTRVHVYTSRYQNAFDPFADLASIRAPQRWVYTPSIRRSAYMEGRSLGEEFQYILNRRYLKRYPGNMLQRPSLLLNPWAVRDTDNESQLAQTVSEYADSGLERDKSQAYGGGAAEDLVNANDDYANLDYLGDAATRILNVKPDADGRITLTVEQLEGAHNITVVAVDAFSVTSTNVYLPLKELKAMDQRLADGLDPEKHFSQNKQVKLLAKGDTLAIEDLISSQVQIYDELTDVHELFKALGNDNQKLRKFSFVLQWQNKNDEEKRALYSKHACHELSFFIKQKDPEFFETVVIPHLKHKREKTFVDRYLLEEDLSEFLEPWKFSRLNAVEKILLSQRLDQHHDGLVRHVNDLYAMSPTPRERYDHFYGTAILGLSLGEEGKSSAWSKSKKRRAKFSDARLSKSDGAVPSDRGGVLGGAIVDFSVDGVLEMNADMPAAAKPKSPSPSKKSKGYFSKRTEKEKEVFKRESSFSAMDDDEEREVIVEDLQRKMGFGPDAFYDFEDQLSLVDRSRNRAVLYRRVEQTKEWMESNYWHLLPNQQNADLVSMNRFWRDYANHDSDKFLSEYFAEASGSFTEMMFALAVLDLPLSGVKENIEYADTSLTITADEAMIVLHQQNAETPFVRGETKLLVSENFYQHLDRYEIKDDKRFDKFTTGPFLAHTLYGAQVVITNPTSTPLSVELLTQIPNGALPANGSRETQSRQFELAAFSTQQFEYSFYFPAEGEFSHYPAHVSSERMIVAVAESGDCEVIDAPKELDITSWAFVSQDGTDDEVIEFIDSHNVLRLDLSQIAFRMQDKPFFLRTIEVLRKRHAYDNLLWSYSVKHNDAAAITEFLTRNDAIVDNCGMGLESEILTVVPRERNWFEQREYWPLINSRAHRLGTSRKILNPSFHQQNEKLMQVLANHAELSDDDHLVVTYVMLLQDRIETALEHFSNVSRDSIDAKMQYDYCDAYLDLYREQPYSALATATKYESYPVDHWRARFENVIAMVNEINGDGPSVSDIENRDQQQTLLASQSASFDFEIESRTGEVNYRNVEELTINYYEMDIELLFSRNPFSRDQMDGFSLIRPNLTQTVSLTDEKKDSPAESPVGVHKFELPAEFRNKNVLVEIAAGDKTKSQACFANSLDVQVIENYGQVHVTRLLEEAEETELDVNNDNQSEAGDANDARPAKKLGSPISKAYVKVYARYQDGRVEFHKDGYTDLRGRFDFVSQSNRSLDGITDYSILIMSDELGAVTREAKPPLE